MRHSNHLLPLLALMLVAAYNIMGVFSMCEGNVTLIGYHSKKQSYVFLIVGILVFITAIFCFFFAEGNNKYASIGLLIFGVMFVWGFVHLLKQPRIALKVIDDKYIFFNSSNSERIINLTEVKKVCYWPAQIGLKITFVTENGGEHVTYLLENVKEVKKHLLGLFEKYDIKVVKRYSKR